MLRFILSFIHAPSTHTQFFFSSLLCEFFLFLSFHPGSFFSVPTTLSFSFHTLFWFSFSSSVFLSSLFFLLSFCIFFLFSDSFPLLFPFPALVLFSCVSFFFALFHFFFFLFPPTHSRIFLPSASTSIKLLTAPPPLMYGRFAVNYPWCEPTVRRELASVSPLCIPQSLSTHTLDWYFPPYRN